MDRRRHLPLALFVTFGIAAAAACGEAVQDRSDLGSDRNPTPTPTPPGGLHHPAGWAAAETHGHAAKFVTEDCRACHGATLQGGSAVSCDGCHPSGWRNDCTFCHGGTDNASGAPPRDITGAVAQEELIFKSHTQHVDTIQSAAPLACTQCHASEVGDALDEGHWFDATPGRAEVVFTGGLSGAGAYDAASGRRSSLYCHGNGRGDNGIARYDDGPRECDSCHPFQGSSEARLDAMSGEHEKHIRGEDSGCWECHGATVNASDAVSDRALHVDGLRQLSFTGTNVTWNANTRTCNGTCHGENHVNEGW